jgi:2-polyprenyl-3-methyl-5-hydroxy-6-metoxy-1,4-benzoquinol methylase
MTHRHSTDEETIDVAAMFTAEFWDERYGATDRLWSGNPNQRLVEHVTGLAPGRALDVGCGEGADAIWLARQGWQVTAMDVSRVALDRAAAHAAQAGAEIAGRIALEQADMLAWSPAPRRFDLVSAQFIHLPPPERDSLFRRLADAVRPGGALSIVGHHPSDLDTSAGRWRLADLMYTAEQIAPLLDTDAWVIVAAAAPARPARDPEGREITIRDAVLFARRR